MNQMLHETETNELLDEETKRQIEAMVYIMENLDNAGRTLMINAGQVLKARNDLERARERDVEQPRKPPMQMVQS